MGSAEAAGIMAERYFAGDADIERHLAKSFEWAVVASRGGDPIGQFRLAYFYHRGGVVGEDYGQALKWYKLAASGGVEQSLNNIGNIYFEGGFGIEQDRVESARWFHNGARKGCCIALRNLAECHYAGLGVPRNRGTAREFCWAASQKGNTDASFRVGVMFIRGDGGPKAVSRGIALVELAARNGVCGAEVAMSEIANAISMCDIIGY